MKHAQLKGNRFACKRIVSVDEHTIVARINGFKTRLQSGYSLWPENVFAVVMDKDGEKLKSKLVHLASMGREDLSHLGNVTLVEYVEKINRFHYVIEDFSFDLSGRLPNLGDVSRDDCEITFRNGGDYIVHINGKDSYGPKLKAVDFNDNGFTTRMFDEKLITYIIEL